MCSYGLHWSERVTDALQYAESPKLYVIEPTGEILRGDDKCCSYGRRYIRRFDIESVLKVFVRKVALRNIHLIEPYTDKYGLIVEYLETGKRSLQDTAKAAAWDVARDAAWGATRAAAWAGSGAATRDAAWAATWAATRAAAWAATRDAARAAAWDVERNWQEATLKQLITDKYPEFE